MFEDLLRVEHDRGEHYPTTSMCAYSSVLRGRSAQEAPVQWAPHSKQLMHRAWKLPQDDDSDESPSHIGKVLGQAVRWFAWVHVLLPQAPMSYSVALIVKFI